MTLGAPGIRGHRGWGLAQELCAYRREGIQSTFNGLKRRTSVETAVAGKAMLLHVNLPVTGRVSGYAAINV